MPTTSEPQLVSAENVTKVFHLRQGLASTDFHAVDDATFTMAADRPEILSIAGESGSGKTTLARMMLGMERATFGSLTYKGKEIGGLSNKEKRAWFYRQVQPVFQDPFAAFSPLNRIDSYLYETVKNYNMAPKAGADEYVDMVLQEVGLSLAEIKGRYPNELSGGQAQRVAVARALITKPSLIVADEPVSMLDASLRMSVINMFRRLKDVQGVSIVYITHDLATAYYSADRIAVMLRGWIVELGPVEHVLGAPLHPYTRNLKDSIPRADPDKKWTRSAGLSVADVEEYKLTSCRFAGRCPHVMDVCRQQTPGVHQVANRAVKCFLYDEAAVGAETVAHNVATATVGVKSIG
jgi:peptide/nickel transport system ATP-binding protein